jgi:hypothetical protein
VFCRSEGSDVLSEARGRQTPAIENIRITLRLQADADLNQIILHAVVQREPTLEFQTAAAAGLTGMRDPQVLALAAREGYVNVVMMQYHTTEKVVPEKVLIESSGKRGIYNPWVT